MHLAIGRAGGWEHHRGDKAIDRVLAGARAAYLHCLLAEGRSVAELAREDPGRELVLPVLRRQSVLANREEARWGSGCWTGAGSRTGSSRSSP
ncbi:hypothetical protein ACFQX6_02920 [Streptosporangium lutulentum]